MISTSVFLIIHRWVWTSQMLYDVRFETGDLPHRVFKFFQLLVLGMNPDNALSDLKRGSQHLQEGLTRTMAFRPTTDLKLVQQINLNGKPAATHSRECRSYTSSVDFSLQHSTHWSTTVPGLNHTMNDDISSFKLPHCVLAEQCGSEACLWKEIVRQMACLFPNSDSGMVAFSSKSLLLLSVWGSDAM